jgi:serine/threonine-protein phosphatase 2A regulatory subunit A
METSTVVTQRMLPTFLSSAQDRSWRVRWSCAEHFSALLKAIEPLKLPAADPLYTNLLSSYTSLLHDPEPEVRSSSISTLANLCTTSELVLSLLPSLPPLIQDSFPHVRSALSAVLPLLAPALGKDNTQAHLLPLLVSERASEASMEEGGRGGERSEYKRSKTLGRRCRCSRPPRSHKRRRSGRRALRVHTK